MKSIKSFFSVAVLFVFVCLNALVLFTVDVFLGRGFYNRTYSGLDLYLEVLFLSFPLALVGAGVLSLYTLLRSGDFSVLVFLSTLFALAFLGFSGIHSFAQDVILREGEMRDMPYESPFQIQKGEGAFFLFRAKSRELLKDVVAINILKSMGALGFYPEGVWSEAEQSLKLMPVSSQSESLVIPKYSLKGSRLVNQNRKSALNFLLMDLYYISYFLITLPFLAFVFNLVGFIILIFSAAQFTALFSRLVAVIAMIGIGRLIFFVYRLFIFDMVFIIKDFGVFSQSLIQYFPFILSLLASVSLVGIWKLISSKNSRRSEKL